MPVALSLQYETSGRAARKLTDRMVLRGAISSVS